MLPTPAIGMIGVLDDVARHLTPAFNAGDVVLLIGASVAQPASTLGGSEYLTQALGRIAGRPSIDLDLEVRVQRMVLDAHGRGLLTAAHDCADGGLAVALVECCLAAGTGIDGGGDLDVGPRVDAALFGEAQSRFIVAAGSEAEAQAVAELASAAGVAATVLGVATPGIAGGERIRLGPVDLALDAAREAYEGALERALAG